MWIIRECSSAGIGFILGLVFTLWWIGSQREAPHRFERDDLYKGREKRS